MASFTTGVYALTALLAAYGFRAAISNPLASSTGTPVPDEERARNVDITPRLMDLYRIAWKMTEYLSFGIAFCEAIASLFATIGGSLQTSSLIPNTIARATTGLCPKDGHFNPQAQFPLSAWVGCISMILGSVLRIWCFRCLGKFFTLEVSIRPGHKLYTDGPYRVVRHPSYTGFTFVMVGQIIFALSGGTFTHECLKWSFPNGFRIVQGMLVCQDVFAEYATLVRMVREDELIKKQFGDDWAAWAKETRYRLLPGIF